MNKIDSILEKVPSDVSINVMLDSMDVSESALAKAGQVEAARDKADTPSDMLSQGPQSARSETDSPRPVPIVDRARRNHILRVIKRSIPIVAKERRDLIRKNAEYSRLCILDAFQGRLSNGLANNSKKSKWIYTIFCIQTSDWMFNSIVIASALHTISIFLEPENTCPNSILFRLFQMIIVLIYAVDVGLKMGYEGVHEYFSHDWQQLYAFNLVIHIVDLLFCGCTCYANPLRPVAGVLRARRGRKFFEVLKKMVPGMMHSLVPIVFFVLIIMGMSSLSFDNLIEEFKSTAYTSYNWLFLIFTNDNFDRLLPGSIMVNMSYLLFFFPAIYVGQRFLLSLIIGDTYETFRSYVKKQLKKEKLKEMQGLTKAFAALDDRKCGVISDFVFKECMTCLHPGMSDEVIALYYELLSGGGVNGVNVLQFLSLRKVLSFKLTVSDQRNYFWNGLSYIKHHAKALYNNIHFPVPCALVESAGHVREYLVNSNWLDYLNIFDIIIFCFDLSEQGVLDKVLGPVYNQFTWCQFISLLYCAEFLIRIVAGKGELGTVSSRNNFVSFLFGIGCLGTILCDIVALVDPDLLQSSVVSLPYGRSFAAVKTLVFFRLLRCVRMANLNEDLKDFTAAIMDIIPALSETFLFTFIVTYIFGTLGHILFGAHMEEWSTPLRSIVKAQQLTFMVSYLDSMESAMETIHPLAILYFAFYLVLSLTVSNIALSIIIDLHGSVLDANTKKNRDAQQKKLDLVFNKIISNARVRHLFSSRNKSLNFKNITLSEFQTSDVRHFITDSSNEKNLNTDDLKLCQKYASVDLVKFYNETYQSQKDVNWEVEFLKSVEELGVHKERTYSRGEILCREGEDANKVFILMQGSVVISRQLKFTGSNVGSAAPTPTNSMLMASSRSGRGGIQHLGSFSIDPLDLGVSSVESALLQPTNLLGAETLQPAGKYRLTVTAEHDTKCFVFSQNDILQKLDSELTGAMLKMAFKSQAVIDSIIMETKKKRRASLIRTSASVEPLIGEWSKG